MKKILAALLASAALASCSVTKDCTTPQIFAFNLVPAVGDTVREDSATVIQFTKDNNFSSIVQQNAMPLLQSDGGKTVLLANVNQPEKYDWKIILMPSGRTYIIKNIYFSNDHVQESRFNQKDVVCFNKVFYTVNNLNNTYDPAQQSLPSTNVYLPLIY